MVDEESESLEWEEVEVTESLPVENEDGLSLEELDDDWEDATGEDPYGDAEEVSTAGDGRLRLHVPDESEDDTVAITPRSILEAILFVGTPNHRPLTAEEIAALMRGVRPDEVDDLVGELNESYEEQGHAFEIVSLQGGYRLQLRDALNSVKNRFYGRVKEVRLSQAAVDVLAIVAYRQPIAREQVDQLRGRPSGGLLNQLVRRRLLDVQFTDTKPRIKQFSTSERFLELFGIEELAELPQSLEE